MATNNIKIVISNVINGNDNVIKYANNLDSVVDALGRVNQMGVLPVPMLIVDSFPYLFNETTYRF